MEELLIKINNNLTNLNINLKSISSRLSSLEKKVDDMCIQQVNNSSDVLYLQQLVNELKQQILNVNEQNNFEIY